MTKGLVKKQVKPKAQPKAQPKARAVQRSQNTKHRKSRGGTPYGQDLVIYCINNVNQVVQNTSVNFPVMTQLFRNLGQNEIIKGILELLFCISCSSLTLQFSTLDVGLRLSNVLANYFENKEFSVQQLLDELTTIIPCSSEFLSTFQVLFEKLKSYNIRMTEIRSNIAVYIQNKRLNLQENIFGKFKNMCSPVYFKQSVSYFLSYGKRQGGARRHKGGGFSFIKDMPILKNCNGLTTTVLYELYDKIKNCTIDELKGLLIVDIDNSLTKKIYQLKYLINFVFKIIMRRISSVIYNILDFIDTILSFILAILISDFSKKEVYLKMFMSCLPDENIYTHYVRLLINSMFIENTCNTK